MTDPKQTQQTPADPLPKWALWARFFKFSGFSGLWGIFVGGIFWRFEGEFVILRMCIGLCVRSLVGRARASVQRHINYESVSLQFQ